MCRYNIYENNNGKPGKKIYSSTPFLIKLNSKGVIIKKINKKIFFNEQGLFFSVEFLGLLIDKKEPFKIDHQNFEKISQIINVVSFTVKKSEYFVAKTYISKFPELPFMPYKDFEHLNHTKKNHSKNIHNLAIYLEYK